MRDFYPYFVYALNERLCGRDTLRRFRELEILQRQSAQKLKELQFEKLQALLAHAYDHTDHYRRVFDESGFDPGAMNSFDDIRKIPLLTKADIRKDPEGFISRDKKRNLKRFATSGSTGHPLTFYLSGERISSNKAVYLLLYSCWDLRIGDKEIVLWGGTRGSGMYGSLKRMRNSLLRTRLLPAFSMSGTIMTKYIDIIKRTRPSNIFGYAHSIYLLSRFAENRGYDLKSLGIKVIFSTAEMLHDYQRETIERVFNCPVSNCYGGRDSGFVAFECPSGRMHLNPYIYTETVNDGKAAGEGEKGGITVTHLESWGMPFIRYSTGDEGVLGASVACGCGRQFPVMEKILGRNTDHIVGVGGALVHPLALEYIFREMDGVDYFRILQKKEDKLIVYVVANSRYDRAVEPKVKKAIDDVMGGPVDVMFEYIAHADIPKENKYRFVVSDITDKKV
jgi:phenylacetate-CoA ligase